MTYLKRFSKVITTCILFVSVSQAVVSQTISNSSSAQIVVVDKSGKLPASVTTITEAVSIADSGATIRVLPGLYREPSIQIDKPLVIKGEPGAILDGDNNKAIMVVGARSVHIDGLKFQNTGTSQIEDRAALRFVEAHDCSIKNSVFDNTFFAIHVQASNGCSVENNTLSGVPGTQSSTGNGIHIWSSNYITVENNHISGHRDAIYFEFVRNSSAKNNTSLNSTRYGLHFMFSDDCEYENNMFSNNRSGVAVMYARNVSISGNIFTKASNSASYGLLLKEINDSRISNNSFIDNTIALYLEGSARNDVSSNLFERNGWAIRLLADAQDNVLSQNVFMRNLFDIGTNSSRSYSTVKDNYWDRYRGYDLNRDGIGDVPHSPVRLFAIVVEKAPASLLLVRSIVADALDMVERIAPVLTPVTLIDETPRIKVPPRVGHIRAGAISTRTGESQ